MSWPTSHTPSCLGGQDPQTVLRDATLSQVQTRVPRPAPLYREGWTGPERPGSENTGVGAGDQGGQRTSQPPIATGAETTSGLMDADAAHTGGGGGV